MKRASPMDRRRTVMAAFAAGLIAAVFLQWTQVSAIGGGWDGLIAVGEIGPGRDFIESDFAEVTLVDHVGHDGQTVYIIARDPFMTDPAAADGLDSPGFRYRRILFPLIAGGFGLLPGAAVVWMMAGLIAGAYATIVASIAALARSSTLATRGVVAMLVAPGLWSAIRTSTVDVLALALLLLALIALRSAQSRRAIVFLALAALTKEIYAVAGLMAGWRAWRAGDRRSAVELAVVPAAVVSAWAVAVTVGVGGGFTPRGNLGPPFVGIIESIGAWSTSGVAPIAIGTMVLASLVAGALLIVRRTPFFGIHLLPWVVIGCVLTAWVWEIPDNAARALVAVWALVVAALVSDQDPSHA